MSQLPHDALKGAPIDPTLPFDPAALADKYLAERDKRLQWNVGTQQYQVMEDGSEPLGKDFWTDNKEPRSPVTESRDALVVGGGFGGLLQAIALIKRGVTNIRIIERGGDFGGTWYWNRFPGAQCDIESYVYMPLLEETGFMPTRKYAFGTEIREHTQRIAKHFNLYEKAFLHTECKSMRWSDENSNWTINTDVGDVITARFVVLAAGTVHRPKFPAVPGLNSFKGHSFHTSRWDYKYTGGDQTGNLSNLKDKRVGIIGTGATSVQAVPHLGAAAKELYVFQRTPSGVSPRGQQLTDPKWAKSLGDKWQNERVVNFTNVIDGTSQGEDLVQDGWTAIVRDPETGLNPLPPAGAPVPTTKPDPAAVLQHIQIADFKQMEKVRKRCDDVVKDKETAEKLKPYYNKFCKRPCFHDEYLPTFNRPSVHLVDTNGKGVEAVTEKGIVANGKEYELDCIIWGTGYDVAGGFSSTSAIHIYGRNGISLAEKWKEGPATLFGMSTAAFPNMFFISILQAAFFPNFHHMVDEQSSHIGHIISNCEKRDVKTLELSQEGEDAWVQYVLDNTSQRRAALANCTPGYYNNEGANTKKQAKATIFGVGVNEYINKIKEWRDNGSFEGFKVEYAPAAVAAH